MPLLLTQFAIKLYFEFCKVCFKDDLCKYLLTIHHFASNLQWGLKVAKNYKNALNLTLG